MSEQNNTRTIQLQPNLMKWTVNKSTKTPIPTSYNYSNWTVDQLRRDCSKRKIKVYRKESKDQYVIRLMEFDGIKGVTKKASVPDAPKKTKNFTFHLINVVFSDEFEVKVGEMGKTISREQLDAK